MIILTKFLNPTFRDLKWNEFRFNLIFFLFRSLIVNHFLISIFHLKFKMETENCFTFSLWTRLEPLFICTVRVEKEKEEEKELRARYLHQILYSPHYKICLINFLSIFCFLLLRLFLYSRLERNKRLIISLKKMFFYFFSQTIIL